VKREQHVIYSKTNVYVHSIVSREEEEEAIATQGRFASVVDVEKIDALKTSATYMSLFA
jgi:microsomal dipeptidase-like Zn-dependent dipeptidase